MMCQILKSFSIGVGIVDYNFRFIKNKIMKKIVIYGILENIKEGKVFIYIFIYIEMIEDFKEYVILF